MDNELYYYADTSDKDKFASVIVIVIVILLAIGLIYILYKLTIPTGIDPIPTERQNIHVSKLNNPTAPSIAPSTAPVTSPTIAPTTAPITSPAEVNCSDITYANVIHDFPLNNILGTSPASTYNECNKLCSETNNCQMAGFDKDNNLCTFYSGKTSLDKVSGAKIPPNQRRGCGNYARYSKTDLLSDEILATYSGLTLSGCEDQCENNRQCQIYSYTPRTGDCKIMRGEDEKNWTTGFVIL